MKWARMFVFRCNIVCQMEKMHGQLGKIIIIRHLYSMYIIYIIAGGSLELRS